MELRFKLGLNLSFFLIFILCSSLIAQKQPKDVEIIFVSCACDFDGSIDFNGIKNLETGPCATNNKLITSDFNDLLILYLDDKKLIEDTTGKKIYGTNLRMYIGISSKNTFEYEFGIDYEGYISYKNKMYYPSKELNHFLCSYVSKDCFCKNLK